MYDLGVRISTLTWNFPNELGFPNPAQEEGKRAMTELLELLDGKKKDTEVVFKNIVKWRGTTV